MTTDIHLIDSHLHLDFDIFASRIPDVLAKANEAGVHTFVSIGCGLASARRTIEIAETYPSVYAAIGIHPHQASKATPHDIAELRKLLDHPKVVAVGEAGLDYHYMNSPKDVQRDVFRQFIRMSIETGYPLVIHSREAEDETLELLREESQGNPLNGVVHCFSGSLPFAEACLEMGLYISVSGIVTFAKGLQKIVKALPLEKLMVETDAPYLAPVPHRGKKNQPAFVRATAEKMASLFKISLAELAAITTANTQTLFRIEDI